MNIGIIGAAEMGTCLASKFIKLGHSVSIANSRPPASLKELAGSLGARAVSVEEVLTENKEVIIISIPQKNIPQLPKDLFRQLPADLIVIETGNYYPTLRDGVIPALVQCGIDSLWVQEQLGVPVIKVFNSILATSINGLAAPKGDKNRIGMAVSGDDPKAKEVVFNLVDDLGFDPFDIGDLEQSWKQQPGSPIYCRDIPREEIKKRAAAMGSEWSAMRDTILAKRTADEALMAADYPAYLKTLRA